MLMTPGPSTKSKPQCLECYRNITGDNRINCRHCNYPLCRTNCSKSGLHNTECSIFRCNFVDYSMFLDDHLTKYLSEKPNIKPISKASPHGIPTTAPSLLLDCYFTFNKTLLSGNILNLLVLYPNF